MEINDIYARSFAAQNNMLKVYQMQPQYQGSVSSNALVPTPSTYAVLGEAGILEPKESFDVNNIDKVNKLNKLANIFRLGSVRTTIFNPEIYGNVGGSNFKGHNPSLSFIPGKVGMNMPLHENAIYTTNGERVAVNLNVIC